MVQMKGALSNSFSPQSSTFISHMVQMKGESYFLARYTPCQLYIPHGSDESTLVATISTFPIHLYIPHGSDERNVKAVVSKKEIKLYIPHGSDESQYLNKYQSIAT